ncbi:Mediator of RNA polymerase II transcription subunit 1 [Nymphon striatum]|nr:Mediator of RNA polymerase II transcription subunit 1 [Nymphon striatum]
MGTQGTGRRRSTGKIHSAEEQALDQISKEAESRLAARRQARAEARDIRLKELERQREADEQNDKHYPDLPSNEPIRPIRAPSVVSTKEISTPRATSHVSSYTNSRRSSEDSTECELDKTRELRHQLNDLEEKFRKAMINNAQLDNEKSSLRHQVDLMKDEAQEMEEQHALLLREHRETYRLHELLKREFDKMRSETILLREAINQRDELIDEHGLVLVGCENETIGEDDDSSTTASDKTASKPMLVSQQAAQLLEQAGEGSLDVRLKRFAEEKQDLTDQVNRLRLELEEEKMKNSSTDGSQINGPEMELMELHREASKQVSDYKFKMKKAEQEIATMQGTITRLENQVTRYKSSTESAEKVEDELRAEKRKIIREACAFILNHISNYLREGQSRTEELETANNHLQKRIDKLKIPINEDRLTHFRLADDLVLFLESPKELQLMVEERGSASNRMHYEGEKPFSDIMNKLRQKAGQYKCWNENAKNMRLALMDKKQIIDSTEREVLQKCLDTLQKSIKVKSEQAMAERLESIARQMGLMFSPDALGKTEYYISSDMFYVDIMLESNGNVKDVKIVHQGEADHVSCPLLAEILRNGQFSEFTSHLEGLVSIYQINAEKKLKNKAYLALKALETDLSSLSELQSSINEPNNLVHRSPVGILEKRVGGQPMKLTYFISPYDLLDIEAKLSIPLTAEIVKSKGLGHYVTVGIESMSGHKLQTVSLLTISKSEGKSLPQFAALSNLNSTTLPACFALQLPSPIPMTVALVRSIHAITGVTFADFSKAQSILSLITQQASEGKLDCESKRGMFVTLPDQHHRYFFDSKNELKGILVKSIPFVHPTHVPQILVYLRQQTLFNELIGSCIRTCSKQDLESAYAFEIVASSWFHISISFEHPSDESIATAELDLSDITNSKCKLHSLSHEADICSDEYASKVLQRCLSIPIMMRAILRKASLKKNGPLKTSQFYDAVSIGMGNSSTRQRIYGSANNSSDTVNGKFGFHYSADGKNGQMGEESDYICGTEESSPSLFKQNVNVLQSNSRPDVLSPTSPSQSSLSSQVNTTLSDCIPPADVNSSNSNISSTDSIASSSSTQQKNSLLMNMLHDSPQNQPVTLIFSKIRKQRKRKNPDGTITKSLVGRSPKRKYIEEDLREAQTPTPSSTPDYIMSSGNTSPAAPYDTSPSFFPGSSVPSNESTYRLTSPIDNSIKSEHLEQSPAKQSTDSGQLSDMSNKCNLSPSSPDMSAGNLQKDHYEFTTADCAEPNLSSYRTDGSSNESEKTNISSFSSRSVEKTKEKKVKKIKSESPSDTKMILGNDIQCSVAEQVAKLHGDPISPLSTSSPKPSSSSSSGSTSIKISTKDGVKISTKVGEIKKQGKRSSSAGVDVETRRKSEAKKEKKRKRAESADALEHKGSSKFLPLPSGTRISQGTEKKSDSIKSLSGFKANNPMSGSGSQSKSPLSKKSPSHSSSTTSPKHMSAAKHSKNSQKGGTNKQISSSKCITSSETANRTLNNKPMKFHSNKEKPNIDKVKVKSLSLSSTTITPMSSSKSGSPSASHSVVASPSVDSNPSFSVLSSPSMSITPVNVSPSPSTPTGSSNKFFPPASSSPSSSSSSTSVRSSGGSNESNNKSPIKSKKSNLLAVIDKLKVMQPACEQPKLDNIEKKTEKKDSTKSSESRKYNHESKSLNNDKGEFTVKQSSQGLKLKVSRNKTSSKNSTWTSTTSTDSSAKSSMSKSQLSSSSSIQSSSTSKKHTNISSCGSNKSVPKSSSSSSSAKSASLSNKPSTGKSANDQKTLSNDITKTKSEDKVSLSKVDKKDSSPKVIEFDKEKAFRLLVPQHTSATESSSNVMLTGDFSSHNLKSITSPVQPKEESYVNTNISQSISNQETSSKPLNFTAQSTEISTILGETGNLTTKKISESAASTTSPGKSYDSVVDLSKSTVQSVSSNPTFVKSVKKFSNTSKSDDDDDELIIDCPGTPRKQKVSFEEMSVAVSDFVEESTPSHNQEVKSNRSDLSRYSPTQPSPVKSPVNASTPYSEVLSNPNSVSRPSPCLIDDDLMDEALMLGK